MNPLKTQLANLPKLAMAGADYLSYQAVTDAVAAFLFPASPAEQMDAQDYQRLLETADSLCRELGYQQVVKLTPPDVEFSDMGLYWSVTPESDADAEPVLIHAGPSRIEMLEEGLLLDAWQRRQEPEANTSEDRT